MSVYSTWNCNITYNISVISVFFLILHLPKLVCLGWLSRFVFKSSIRRINISKCSDNVKQVCCCSKRVTPHPLAHVCFSAIRVSCKSSLAAFHDYSVTRLTSAYGKLLTYTPDGLGQSGGNNVSQAKQPPQVDWSRFVRLGVRGSTAELPLFLYQLV